MKLHANAALSLNGRRRLVRMVIEQGRSIATAAEAAGVSERTCSKWVARYRVDGELEELLDLLRPLRGPPVQEPEIPQPRRRSRHGLGPCRSGLGRTATPGRRPRSAPQRGSQSRRLGR